MTRDGRPRDSRGNGSDAPRVLRAIGYAYAAGDSTAEGGARAGVVSQSASIRARCERQGFELVEVVHDEPETGPGGPVAQAALETVRSGGADVLVTALLGTLAGDPEDLAGLIDESVELGWGLVGADLGVDTTTRPGLAVARYASATLGRGGPPAVGPIPPPELLYLVTGTDNGDWFDRTGRQAADELEQALSIAGCALAAFRSVLDFGCGPGRILRHLATRLPAARLTGCDIQDPALAWLSAHLPGVEVVPVDPGGLPPLASIRGSFDLTIGYSVMTHFDERYQDAWLAELSRLLEPGGIALLSVNGRRSWDWHAEGPLAGLDGLQAMEERLVREGFLFWSGDGWEAWFPDFYHSAWHLPEYVRRRWSRWFEVVEVLEGAAGPTQDLVVLRRPSPGGRHPAAVTRRGRTARRRPRGNRARERRRERAPGRSADASRSRSSPG